MSVVLSFEICESSNCNNLSFKETTGAYDVDSNSTGWNTPNTSTDDATGATLTITMASGTSYVIDLFATGNFPTTDTGFIYDIINTDIGLALTDTIPDQIITFLYTVTTATDTYTQTIQQSFYCNVNCCVNSMFLDLDFECNSCGKDIDKALEAFAMLQGLKYNSNCGNADEFNNILAQLNKLCVGSSCTSCN